MNGEMGILALVGSAVAAIAWKAGLVLGLSAAVTGCTLSVSFSPLDAIDHSQTWSSKEEAQTTRNNRR